MRTERNDLWQQLRDSISSASCHEYCTKALWTGADCCISAAISRSDGKAALVLEAPNLAEMIPALPETVAFSTSLHRPYGIEPSRTCLILTLERNEYWDLFEHLIDDLLAHLRLQAPAEPIPAALECIERWRRFFLQSNGDALSIAHQQALYAELWLMEALLDCRPALEVVQSWMGPEKHKHDFELPTVSVEVKSTRTRPPMKVTINNLRQTDPSHRKGIAGLNIPLELLIIGVDVATNTGISLSGQVDCIRGLIALDSRASWMYEQRLILAGYVDEHAPHYNRTKYTVDGCYLYHVTSDFPRISPNQVADGIHHIRYELDLAAIREFAADFDTWIQHISNQRGEDA